MVCGNNVVEVGEVCDDGNTDNGDGCDPTCQFQNVVSLVAGVADGKGWADGTGFEARLDGPSAVATDQVFVYFGDACTVRRYDPTTKKVLTLAGARDDCAPTDGIGSAARFAPISDIEFFPNAASGVLYITGGSALRKLDLDTNTVSSLPGVAGSGTVSGDGISSDATHLYLVDNSNGLRSVLLSDKSTVLIADINKLGSVCSDVVPAGSDFYLTCGVVVLKVTPGAMPNTPTVTTFAGGAPGCAEGALPTQALFTSLNHLVGGAGTDLYATDDVCDVVWHITPGGVFLQAGKPGVAGHDDGNSGLKSATFDGPNGLATINNLTFVADTNNRLLRDYSAFAVETDVGVFGPGVLQGTTKLGPMPILGSPVFVIDNGTTPLVATFNVNGAVTALVDTKTGIASQFYPDALLGVIIGKTLYATPGKGDGTIWSYPLDGSMPTLFAGKANAQNLPPMDGPKELAILSANFMATDGTNLFFADTSGTLREVDMAKSQVVTLAGTPGSNEVVDGVGAAAHIATLGGLTCDGPNLYFIDGTLNSSVPGSVIRKLVVATKEVTTIAGKSDTQGAVDGIGAAARFAGARSLTTDGHALYIADPGQGLTAAGGDGNGPTVRELELATNRVTTMVGARGQWTWRPGVGTAAALNTPASIVFDKVDHLLLLVDLYEDVMLKVR